MKKELIELKKLRANLRKIEDTYDYYKKLFEADGTISKEENVALEKMKGNISDINTEIDQQEEKLSFGTSFSNVINKSKETVSDVLSKKDDAPLSVDELAQKDIDVTFEDEPVVEPVVDEPVVVEPVEEPVIEEPIVKPVASVIKKSVGLKGDNDKEDVLIVQKLLKDDWNYDVPQTGECDNLTIRAIGQFQYRFVGSIKKQDSKIDAGGNTWKYLIGEKKPTLGLQEDGTLAGAETEDEKKLAEFVKAVGDIQVEIAPNEFIGVRPPYHMNSTKRRTAIDATRAKNSSVSKVINDMGWNDSHGKATPKAIKEFLETCIGKGLIKDKSSNGLNQFLDKYGITLDCSGLAVQSVNFMEEGNLTRENGADGETLKIVNAASIMRNGTKITKPSDLKAGDMMVIKTHVRVITDVDDQTDGIAFTTVESGAEKNLGYGGGVGNDGADGVGERRWLFPNKQEFKGIKRLSGNTWEVMSSEDKYVYRRMDAKAREVYK
jgi:hypothetical protein